MVALQKVVRLKKRLHSRKRMHVVNFNSVHSKLKWHCILVWFPIRSLHHHALCKYFLLPPNKFWIQSWILTQSDGDANQFHWNRLLCTQVHLPQAETLLCPLNWNPRQSTWRWVFMEHLAKSFGQSLYLLKHQSQCPRKYNLTDRMLYLHQSFHNNSFSLLAVAKIEERSTSPPSHAVWQGGVSGSLKAMLPHMAAAILQCCWQGSGLDSRLAAAQVAAGGRHILCTPPQACPSPATLLYCTSSPSTPSPFRIWM